MNILPKLLTSFVLALFVFIGLSTPAEAISIRISGNTNDDNEIRARLVNETSISPHNDSDIDNTIVSIATTGDNEVNRNARGHISIESGDIRSNISVENWANFNYARYSGSNWSGWDYNRTGNDWDEDKGGDYNKNKDYGYDKDNKHDKDSNKKDHDYSRDWDKDKGGNYDKDSDHDKKDWEKDYDDHDKSKDHDKPYKNEDEDKKHEDKNDMHSYPHKYISHMTGEKEAPHKGDPDGHGWSRVAIRHEDANLCVEMKVHNIELPATEAHIHYGKPGEAGPALIHLPKPNEDGYAKGCMHVDNDLLYKIDEHPYHYYINVHNHPYPEGAVRDQLHEVNSWY